MSQSFQRLSRARSYPPFSWREERALLVAQGPPRRSSKPRRSRPQARDWENLADELEQREDYRERLDKVLARSVKFQATLSEPQLAHWLELEEALLELSWFLHGEYFKSGFELGRKTGRKVATSPGPAASQAQAELALALSQLIRQSGR